LLLIMKKDQQPLDLTWFDCHMSCNKKFMLHMYTSSRFGSLNDMLSWLISDLVTMFSTNKLLYTHIPKMSIVSSDTIFCEIYFHTLVYIIWEHIFELCKWNFSNALNSKKPMHQATRPHMVIPNKLVKTFHLEE
jgi:hypothetical protein